MESRQPQKIKQHTRIRTASPSKKNVKLSNAYPVPNAEKKPKPRYWETIII